MPFGFRRFADVIQETIPPPVMQVSNAFRLPQVCGRHKLLMDQVKSSRWSQMPFGFRRFADTDTGTCK